ncbi:AAA family ATPase [Nonomuraea sp. MCN248]|uniref:AAA family ATPase n=1 Tax=Nonomuraea corallina TaxID=2989783 RepID=A0ABT4SM78_9ACTN|nr:AAA family ATPase [Nonomuraea corallina]MDA0638346.1 AAA family ATPase [Nonomuraea corallina]
MARHDREESLEEQLAWLDAIKESEEAPVKVSAKTGPGVPADETMVVSPYPQDPWASVPQHDTPTPPLFRAAVDSVYGAEAVPASESEAGEWLDRAAGRDDAPDDGADTRPAIDDAFLAPLKPLPRPDDTDSYALTSFPEPGKPERREQSEEQTEENLPWPVPPAWAREKPAETRAAETRAAEAGAAEDGSADEPADEPVDGPADGPQQDREQPRRTFPEPRPSFDSFGETHPSYDEPRPSYDEPRPSFGGRRPSSGESRPVFPEPPRRSFDEPSPPFAEPSQRAFTGGAEPRTFDEHLRFQEPDVSAEPRTRPEDPPPPRHRPAPVPVFNAPPRPPLTGRPNAESLDPDTLLRGRRNAPSKGWRRLVYKASGGWIKPGEPPEVRRRRALMARARTPVATGHHRVAVLSLKGGVGKTTTTVGLGATLAQIRGDRVIAVDANPDRGTLSDKLRLETSATVRDLLTERDQVKRYVDIRAFTSQAPSRLEVLASDRDPSVSEAFSGADYQAVSQVLENFYSICITDCGTGLLHSAMGGVLGLADQIVLVSSPSVDGARAASATLDWLEAHHYENLVREATVVLCSVRPRSKSAVDLNKLEGHFAARCRAVVRVPYDPHLEEGAEIDLDRLQEATRDAYLQLAASVGDGFAGPGGEGAASGRPSDAASRPGR